MTVRLIRVEKETASIGLFATSRRPGSAEPAGRYVARTVHSENRQAGITVKADPVHGLPTVEDQDWFLALQMILTEIYLGHGTVSNPVSFPNARLLRILRRNTDSGRHHERIRQWFRRMAALRIRSESAVRHAATGSWHSGDLTILDRVIAPSDERVRAGRGANNQLWLSWWFVENLNHGHVFPLDLDSYLELRYSIARLLAPILHVWMYASRRQGWFEKDVGRLHQLLGLSLHEERWRIRARFTPGLEELRHRGYLSEWKLVAGRRGPKLVFLPGEKLAGRFAANENHSRSSGASGRSLIGELLRRGIGGKMARSLLGNLEPDQPVQEQLEWGDHLVQSHRKITNPPGFYVHLLQTNVAVPRGFVSSRQRQRSLEQERARDAEIEHAAKLEAAYMDYRERAIETHISEQIAPHHFQTLCEEKRRDTAARFPRISRWTPEALHRFLQRAVRDDIARELDLLSFDRWAAADGDCLTGRDGQIHAGGDNPGNPVQLPLAAPEHSVFDTAATNPPEGDDNQ